MNSEKIIVIGASAGGVNAICKILKKIPKEFPIPIIIVQHIPKKFSVNVALVYKEFSDKEIFEVEDKMPIESGKVYFAPSDYHLLLEKNRTFSLNQDDLVQFSRPSIDVLFESASWSFGKDIIGVLLTGANFDGAEGLEAIQKAGGFTIVQDPKTAEAPVMPRAALNLMQPEKVLDLEAIAETLLSEGAIYA